MRRLVRALSGRLTVGTAVQLLVRVLVVVAATQSAYAATESKAAQLFVQRVADDEGRLASNFAAWFWQRYGPTSESQAVQLFALRFADHEGRLDADFETRFWRRYGRTYAAFLPTGTDEGPVSVSALLQQSAERFEPWRLDVWNLGSDRPSRKRARAAADQADEGPVSVSALLQQSAERFEPSGLGVWPLGGDRPSRKRARAATGQPVRVTLYDPITNLLIRAGAEATLTNETLATMQEALGEFLDAAPNALTYIATFLGTGRNLDFAAVPGASAEYATLRLQLLDVLAGGGEQAEAVLLRELRLTNDAQEIATLTDYLDRSAAGEYATDALAAARGRLARASLQPLDDKSEKLLRDIVAMYRDAGTGDDVETPAKTDEKKDKKESDAENIPSLIAAARGGADDERLQAIRELARYSSQDAAARAELIQQAEDDRIPDGAWPDLAIAITMLDSDESIAQDELPPPLSDEELEARLDVIAELLEASEKPSAIDALEEAATLLELGEEEE